MRGGFVAGVIVVAGALVACADSTQPAVPVSVTLSDSSITLDALGATHTITARVTDGAGHRIAATVSWTSDNPAVVTVDSSGTATAVTEGTAELTASVATLRARAMVVVAQAPAALVKVGGDAQAAPEGATELKPVVVRVLDRLGAPVRGATVRFAAGAGSGAASPATVTSAFDGSASTHWTLGVPGTQRLVASAGDSAGVTAAFAATAWMVGPVTITGMAPDTLAENDSATVRGTGFDPNVAFDAVRVDGLDAAVIAATDTSLRIVVPTADCLPPRVVAVAARVGSVGSSPATAPLRPAAYTSLRVGQQTIIQSPAAFCLQFAASGTGGDAYLIGVGAAAADPSVLNGFTMIGMAGLGPVAAPTAVPALTSVPVAAGHVAPASTAVEREAGDLWRHQYAAEARVRAFERAVVPTLARAARMVRSDGGPRAAPTSADAVPAVGDTVTIRVPDFDSSNPCGTFATIHTTVKAVGASGIWLSDLANPLTPDSLTDAAIRAYSDTFDTTIFPTDTSWFGAPSDIDANGRIIIVLTIEVNRFRSLQLAGFTFGPDLFPGNLACPASNGGEVFYSEVPDPDNAAGTVARPKAVATAIPDIIAHEFTHEIQFGRRFILSPTSATNVPESSWVLEGQATFAQNAVGDVLLGNSAGNNYGAAVALASDGRRWYSGLIGLAAYYGYADSGSAKIANAPEQCSLFDASRIPVACLPVAYYGASYAFQKYVTDRFGPTYPGGPKALQHDVIDAHGGLFGKANWAATVGFDFDSVFSQWAAMLYVDDSVPGVGPALQMTSWNLADIFGSAGLGGARCGASCQLIPVGEAWGSFTQSRSVRDGSTAYTVLTSSGPHPSLAIRVRDPANSVLRGGMEPQLWVVRIR